MAFIQREQLTEILSAAPPGTDPELVVNALLERGHTLEGFNEEIEIEPKPFLQKVKEFAIGAAKGAGSTIAGASALGEQILGKTGEMAFGGAVKPRDPEGMVGTQLRRGPLQPQTPAEQAGFLTEQIGEFVGTGIALGGPAKAGLEALTGAGLTALQEAKVGKEAAAAGVVGGGLSLAASGVGALLKKASKTAWSSILKRTPTEAVKAPKLPEQAAALKMRAMTRGGVLEKSLKNIQELEVALDDLLASSQGKVNGADVADFLGGLKQTYTNIPGEQAAVDVIEKLQDEFAAKGALSVLEAHELKRDIYRIVEKTYGKGLLEVPAKKEAQKLAARALKEEIESIIPDAKTLNQKQAVYIQIKDALEKTIARTEGKGIAGTNIGLLDVLLAGSGLTAGIATKNPMIGLSIAFSKKALESPAFLTSVANMAEYFNQLSPTKKVMFFSALKGLTTKGAVETTK